MYHLNQNYKQSDLPSAVNISTNKWLALKNLQYFKLTNKY